MGEHNDDDWWRAIYRERKNSFTVPIGPWWPEKVREKLDELELAQKEICDAYGFAEHSMTRCLKLENTNLDIAVDTSRFLELPPPVFIAKTYAEAKALQATQKKMRRLLENADAAAEDILDEDVAAERSRSVKVAAPTVTSGKRRVRPSTDR